MHCLSFPLTLTFYNVTTTLYYDPILKSWKKVRLSSGSFLVLYLLTYTSFNIVT